MFRPVDHSADETVRQLASGGYWPARAAVCLAEGRYSRAVEICNEHLPTNPESVSGRLILARALFQAGQIESAGRQFHQVLALDPDNLVALKHLGDIAYNEGDKAGAMTLYARVLEIDPHCHGLRSELTKARRETTRTITLKGAAGRPKSGRQTSPLREIPFYTETIGDLYLAQGYPRLAAEVFRNISERNPNPRLAGKLAKAEKGIIDKDK
jgi:tetratricopeptide (TPR) repeat protein